MFIVNICHFLLLSSVNFQAVSIDGSDVTVWYQLAQVSCHLGNLLLGRKTLEQVSEGGRGREILRG